MRALSRRRAPGLRVASRAAFAVLAATGLLAPGTGLTSADGAAAARSQVAGGAIAQGSDAAGTYLVVLRSEPLATYDGGIPGLTRTAPHHGERFDAERPAVQRYEDHLLAEQAQLLSQLGSPSVLYHYTTVLDGFAATLTSDQVATLRDHTDVAAIEPSRLEHLTGDRSSDTLGLSGDHGIWQSLGGPAHAGKGTVIGFVDSGIWPENPSFAGVPLDRRTRRTTYPGFTGRCEAGERWSAGLCNAKVVAARSFLTGFGRSHLAAAEYASPRDGSGHGSHVAAIAAGNAGVDVSVGKQHFGRVAGVAPAAGIAVYKACWAAPDPSDDGCATPDTVMAVDQAVHDGVDVLNYSVSGHDRGLTDVVELAFLNAASAGVFVSAAAGDDGPRAGTVSHQGPWVTTVAASRTDSFQGSVVLANGRRFTGSMVSNRPIRHAPLLLAADAPSAGADRREAAHCFPGSLDARKVDGAIVVCDRGINGRVIKSQTVKQSGGVGMVLVNQTHGSTDADLHAVPTVHVTENDGSHIIQYVEKAAHPTASLDPATSEKLPRTVAGFSSRGPATVAGGDVLKPDVTAPGVSVLAAVAPPSNFGHLWDVYSGTSMAAPQVSGLAAIVGAVHPSWTPAMTKSALMTTARPIGSVPLPLDQGAGEVEAGSLLDPGLVYDAGRADWLGYLAGSGAGAAVVDESGVSRIDAVDLNSASIAVGSLVGEETVTRTVTNVGRTTETYTAKVDGLRGVAVSVSRPSLTLRPGQSAGFDLTLSARKTARYERFARGSLTWTGSRGHVVRSPIVARPELVDAPAVVTGVEPTGTLSLTARAGVTGTIATRSRGLVGAAPTGFVLRTGSFDQTSPRADASTAERRFTVPMGTSVARFDVRTAGVGDDLDLYVYRDGTLVDSAAGSAGDETVTLDDPAPGSYAVFVHAASATGDITLGSLTGWVIRGSGRPAVGNESVEPLDVGPARVTVTGGRAFSLDVRWRHLDRSLRWLGVISYDDSPRHTLVSVN